MTTNFLKINELEESFRNSFSHEQSFKLAIKKEAIDEYDD